MDSVSLGKGHQFTHLGQVGVSIDRHGVMSLDESKLEEVIANDPVGIHVLFSAQEDSHGAHGVATRLDQQLTSYLRSGQGILARRDQMHERMLRQIDDRMQMFERRIERREVALRRQFTALERALSEMQGQGMWLQGQIDALAGLRGSK